ncbi:MAG: ferredoxin reductase family protein [Pseudonocardiaceae bacterium]
MRRQWERVLWAVAFVGVLATPMMLSVRTGGQSSLVSELSVGMGLLATSMVVCAVVLPSRLRSLTRCFGIDGVLGMHRFAGLVAAILVVVHIVLVVAADPANTALFDVIHAPGRTRAALGATTALGAMIALAVLRRRLGHRYEIWRWVHLTLAAALLIGTALHIWWLDHLVRDPTMRAWLTMLVVAVGAVLGYRWLWRPAFDTRSHYLIREVRPETDTVSTLVLTPRHHHHPLTFAPGQFAWLRLHAWPRAQEHPFTIASATHTTAPEFTIRHRGDFTDTLRHLTPGTPIWVDGPHGAFSVDLTPSTGLVMIAGGVGITPMMSMLRTLAQRRDRRPHRLITIARTPHDLLFRDELQHLTRHLDLTVIELIRHPPPGWTGPAGDLTETHLTTLLPGTFRRNQLDYFLCGPPTLIHHTLTLLDKLHIPHPRIHTEQFDHI